MFGRGKSKRDQLSPSSWMKLNFNWMSDLELPLIMWYHSNDAKSVITLWIWIVKNKRSDKSLRSRPLWFRICWINIDSHYTITPLQAETLWRQSGDHLAPFLWWNSCTRKLPYISCSPSWPICVGRAVKCEFVAHLGLQTVKSAKSRFWGGSKFPRKCVKNFLKSNPAFALNAQYNRDASMIECN